jgi:hypothetical protein
VKKKKATYRIRNWKEYNRALKQRGSLTIWVSQEATENWMTEEKSGQRGASDKYTDLAIETMAMVQAVYGLPGRQTQGFLQSIFELMGLDLSAPDHSTLSRRRKNLTVHLPVKKTSKARHLVIDSTGVKVYGEGEWKVRQHGWSKRRTWLKLHVCVDESSFEIISACATTNNVSDGEVLPDLIKDVSGPISQVSADGAYDQRACYDAINGRGARAAIPPLKDAKIWRRATPKSERHIRDENLREIRRIGRKKWKQDCGYHRWSLAETTMFRFKTICGDRLKTRKIDNQFKELLVKCAVLNGMTHLGMPESYKV